VTDTIITPVRLRIQSIIVTPVLVWDDGEELTAGPELGQISVPLSKLGEFAANLPAEVEALATRLAAEATPPAPAP
jgi:hypothetical protein